MIVCKLTDKDMRTYGGTQWSIGEWKETSGEGPLCTSGWLHWYSSPLLAALHHPLHVTYAPPIRAWEAEADGTIKIEPMKGGSSRLRLLKEIELPEVSLAVRVRYAIYCAKAVLAPGTLPSWNKWADAWLQGERDKGAARAAVEAEESAAWAARAAAEAAWAVDAAWASARAARAVEAAWAAARAANCLLSIQEIAESVVKDEEEFQQNRKAPR